MKRDYKANDNVVYICILSLPLKGPVSRSNIFVRVPLLYDKYFSL